MEEDMELFEYFKNQMYDYINIKNFEKGSLIFNESESLDNVYIVKSGTVEMFKITKSWDERIIFLLSEGMILNEEVLFSDKSYCNTCCRAFARAKVYIIPKNRLLEAMKKDSKIMEYVCRNSNIKLARVYRQLKNSGSNISIEKKVSSKLWKLSQDFGVKDVEGIRIDLSLTSTTIAKMIGATRETVSRCLNSFKKEKIISINSDTIIILDLELLENKYNKI